MNDWARRATGVWPTHGLLVGGSENTPDRARTAMFSFSAVSLSGMKAAQTSLDASAHNLANLQTEGFRRQRVMQSTQADGGLTTSLSRSSEAGNAIETDLVGQLVAKNQFLANLAVFKTGDQMMGSLLDTTG